MKIKLYILKNFEKIISVVDADVLSALTYSFSSQVLIQQILFLTIFDKNKNMVILHRLKIKMI